MGRSGCGGFLGVKAEDIEAWSDLRNAVAHGNLAFNYAEAERRTAQFDQQEEVVGHQAVMQEPEAIGRFLLRARPGYNSTGYVSPYPSDRSLLMATILRPMFGPSRHRG